MKLSQVLILSLVVRGALLLPNATAAELPGGYFPLLEAGAAMVAERLAAEPQADLAALEARPGWRHFPYAILAPAVLYAKEDPGNSRYHDRRMLELVVRIGDLLADENEKGRYEPRLDSDWDTYMWLEAYRLLERDLGEARRARWRRAIEENVSLLVSETRERLDFPWYQSPFIGTSPNHYAQWASLLHFAGCVFANREWQQLGAAVLCRFATTEQTPDGYWGEHNHSGPTTGYNHLTLTGLALYYEHSRNPVILPALRRATDFHKYFTYPDGTPVEVINDRNRYWGVSAWGQFAFTNFPDGRRYAEFLTGFFSPNALTIDELGRLAQDALYYHPGPMEPIPQDMAAYYHSMTVPAGVRKTGPWVVCLSGIISTQAVNNQFYLDRQGNLSVYRTGLGLIISGANSKRQPELATFSEKLLGQVYYMPVSSRLQMGDAADRLSLAYNSFFCDLHVPVPSESEQDLHFAITGKGDPPEEACLTLQLCLKPGEVLETAAGRKFNLSADRVELAAGDIGAWIRHRGWMLKTDSPARLIWPVYPFNPYANGPETNLAHAVGALSVPLQLKPGRYIRPGEQRISFSLAVPGR